MTTILLCLGGALWPLGILLALALCRMARLADDAMLAEE